MAVFELRVVHEWQYSKKKISGGLSELQFAIHAARPGTLSHQVLFLYPE